MFRYTYILECVHAILTHLNKNVDILIGDRPLITLTLAEYARNGRSQLVHCHLHEQHNRHIVPCLLVNKHS